MLFVKSGANTHRLSGFQSIVLESIASASLGNLLDMHILRPIPDQLNQKLWDWAPAVLVLTLLPGDSDAYQNLRTPGPDVYQTNALFLLGRE